MYCKKCGGKLESYASNCAFCGTPVEKYDTNMEYVKEKKVVTIKPMTTWKWVGLFLLLSIPVVGILVYLILMFKWSAKSNPDLSLKSFAKANLILFAIAIVVTIILIIVLIIFFPNVIDELKDILIDIKNLVK